MVDIILAGESGEKFGGVEAILAEAGEAFDRLEVEITEPGFQEMIADRICGVIVTRFHEGDLATIKAMQTIRLKKPFLKFFFITDKELHPAILTLMFNEGAYGTLMEPLSKESSLQIIRHAIKRSKWETDEATRNRDLLVLNESLIKKMEKMERDAGRFRDIIEKMDKFVYFLLTDKGFKPKQVKILFVSDSSYQRNLFEELFGKIGFNVRGVISAESALPEIKSFEPDIVVSDLELTGMSGVEMAREVKGKKGYPRLHFVILTANEDKMDYILSPDTMVDDCVIKPGDNENVHGVVAKIAMGTLSL
ncbi:MAG: response regulator [Rectinemataceae bacterium]|nr:response regulator [Rectinemataceae bacterium]